MSSTSALPEVFEALRGRYRNRALAPRGLFLLGAPDAIEFLDEGLRLGLHLTGVEGFWTQSGGYQPDQQFSNAIDNFNGTATDFVARTKDLIRLGGKADIKFEVWFSDQPFDPTSRAPRGFEKEAHTMIRATEVLRAGSWSEKPADTVTLDAQGRLRRRIAMRGEGGLSFLLDLAQTTNLRDNDGLRLEDGRIVLVRAAPELLAEITAADATSLARIAFQLGNRHFPAQFVEGRIRIRRDHVIEPLVLKLGAAIQHIAVPFDPEGSAYDHLHGS